MFNRKKKGSKQETNDAVVIKDSKELSEEEVMKIIETKMGGYSFNDFDPKLEKENKDIDNPFTVVEDEIHMIEKVPNEVINNNDEMLSKKDLTQFFENDLKNSEKLKIKEPKQKKEKTKSNRKEKDLQDVKDRKVFKYKKKKYTKVEDFVKFVNDHYLDMDLIAREVLDNENFYGWISKKSGKFEESLKEFKDIKEKIQK